MTSIGLTAGSVAALAIVAQLSLCGQTIDLTTIDNLAGGICKLAPDLPTIEAFVHANGALQTAGQIAQEICNIYLATQAVNPAVASAKQGAAPGTDVTFVTNYNGHTITVHGTITK